MLNSSAGSSFTPLLGTLHEMLAKGKESDILIYRNVDIFFSPSLD